MTARAASGMYVCARVSAIREPHTTKLPCHAAGISLAWLIFTVLRGNPVARCRTSRSTFAEIATLPWRRDTPTGTGHTAPDQTHRYRAGAAAAVEDAVVWCGCGYGDVSVCGARGVGRCCVEGVGRGCVWVRSVGHRRGGPRCWSGIYLLHISEWFGSDVIATCSQRSRSFVIVLIFF